MVESREAWSAQREPAWRKVSTDLAQQIAVFLIGGAVSLAASHVLTARLERLGARLRLSEALLGLVTALAADSPEITSSVSAIQSGQHTVGIGVVLGSNVFNLAALLGLGSLAAGRLHLHRNVVALEAGVALCVVGVALGVAGGPLLPGPGLLICLVVLVGYGFVIGAGSQRLRRLPLPERAVSFLDEAACEECLEVGEPEQPPRGSRARGDVVVASVCLLAVVGASIAMERSGVALGHRAHLSAIVIGGIVLAAVTSLPNAVAAVYLARRGRATAVLSEAMNSNALNVTFGLLVPGLLIGIGPVSPTAFGVAVWYGALTFAALAVAYARRGFGRLTGGAIIGAYLVFVALLVV
jgi:cation:H+ antiporter